MATYMQQGNIEEILSFLASDAPGPLREDMYPAQIGRHYFGDLLLSLRLSEIWAPYETPGIYWNTYPLFAGVVIAPLSLVPYPLAVTIFLFVTVAVLIVPLLVALKESRYSQAVLLVAPLLLVYPMIMVLDRGNLQGIVVGLALIGMIAFLRTHYVVAGVFFALAAAMKATPLLLLLFLVKVRAWKALAVSLLTGLTVTIFSSAFYSGGTVHNLLKWKEAASAYQSPTFDDLVIWNNSFRGMFASLSLVGPSFLQSSMLLASDHYNVISGVCIVFLVGLIVSSKVSLFSSVLYVSVILANGAPITAGYTSLFYFLVVLLIFQNKGESKVSTFFISGLLAAYLAPKGILICGKVHLYTIVNPLIAGMMVLTAATSDVHSIFLKLKLSRVE